MRLAGQLGMTIQVASVLLRDRASVWRADGGRFVKQEEAFCSVELLTGANGASKFSTILS